MGSKSSEQKLARALQSVVEDELKYKPSYTFCLSIVEKHYDNLQKLRTGATKMSREELACKLFEMVKSEFRQGDST